MNEMLINSRDLEKNELVNPGFGESQGNERHREEAISPSVVRL